MRLGDRIAELRRHRQISQNDLAVKIGTSRHTVYQWEANRSKPSVDFIVPIAKALSVTPNELFDLDEAKLPSIQPKPQKPIIKIIYKELPVSEQKLLDDFRVLDEYGKKAVSSILAVEKQRTAADGKKQRNKSTSKPEKTQQNMIRRYLTPAAAGYSAPIDGEDYEMIKRSKKVPQEADYAVKIQGNSMAPYIMDGDTVYAKRVEELERGDVGIFSVDGAMYCKILYRDEIGNVTLVSANPEFKESNVWIMADSSSTLQIYGKVLLKKKVKIPDYFYDSL